MLEHTGVASTDVSVVTGGDHAVSVGAAIPSSHSGAVGHGAKLSVGLAHISIDMVVGIARNNLARVVGLQLPVAIGDGTTGGRKYASVGLIVVARIAGDHCASSIGGAVPRLLGNSVCYNAGHFIGDAHSIFQMISCGTLSRLRNAVGRR